MSIFDSLCRALNEAIEFETEVKRREEKRMMDKYEKIVWALRECCDDGSGEAQESDCYSCPYKEHIVTKDYGCSYLECADKLGRDAADAIEGGVVFVNDLECTKPDRKIRSGDKIVFRRKGRIIVDDCSGVSKKGRIIVNIIRNV